MNFGSGWSGCFTLMVRFAILATYARKMPASNGACQQASWPRELNISDPHGTNLRLCVSFHRRKDSGVARDETMVLAR